MIWKIYFFIIALQTIGVPVGAVLFSEIKLLDLVNWAFVIAGVIGLFGFAYSKPILQQQFWKGFAPLFVLWDIFFLFVWSPAQESNSLGDSSVLHTLPIFLFLCPQYFALFKYGHKKDHLWNSESAT